MNEIWTKAIYIISIAICALGLLFLIKKVATTYSSPVELRCKRGQWDMTEGFILIKSSIPNSEMSELTCGIWYPENDPVTKKHLNMIFSYHLYPLKFTSLNTNKI